MAGTPSVPYPHSERFRAHLVELLEASRGWDGHQVERVEVLRPPAGPVIVVRCVDGTVLRIRDVMLSAEPGSDWARPDPLT